MVLWTHIDWLSPNNIKLVFRQQKTRSKLLLAFALFGLSVTFKGQNLVPNPSFETYTSCPTAFSQINKAPPWIATNNSSELFNFCGTSSTNAPNTWYGYQSARTGNAYAGQYFMNNYGSNSREYIQVPLTATLTTGSCYLVKFYVNCVNKIINYACNNFAAHLSFASYTTGMTAATVHTPQIYLVNNPIIIDTLNWIEIGGIYTASGGESHLTIGNFKNDANTDTLRTNNGTISAAYYYIDDVSVTQITSPTWQLRDTMIIGGDSVLIGPLYSGLTCNWFDMLGNPIGSGAGMWVKPATTTSYILQQTFCNNTFSDTMTVYVSGLGIKEQKSKLDRTKIYPNPNNGEFVIEWNKVLRDQLAEILILDVSGKVVFFKSSNENVISLKVDLGSGVYLMKVKMQDGTSEMHKLVITK